MEVTAPAPPTSNRIQSPDDLNGCASRSSTPISGRCDSRSSTASTADPLRGLAADLEALHVQPAAETPATAAVVPSPAIVASHSSASAASSNGSQSTSSSGHRPNNGCSTPRRAAGSAGSLASSTTASSSLKKRISSCRTPAAKARRIRFFRNGDRFYAGIVIAVSGERYRTFDSLVEDLTRLMEDKIAGAVRNIYSTDGRRIADIDELADGTEFVCLCNNETFKRLEYSAQPNRPSAGNGTNRLSRHLRSGSPQVANGPAAANGDAQCVRPRIVTLVRNGTKPRRVLRLLLNKRNSASFDHVLTAITQCVKLDSGCVRKVFTPNGTAVQRLADFFASGEDVFFAYGSERVQADDFRLDGDEQKAVAQTRARTMAKRTAANSGGPKPRMPVKNSVNLHNQTYEADADASMNGDANGERRMSTMSAVNDGGESLLSADEIGPVVVRNEDLPDELRDRFDLGPMVGEGNFAVVLRVQERSDATPVGRTFALKIIDKAKCKGKEHYIDAEVRVMKKLQHPYIMALYCAVETPANMFLVLEYVSGGDLFDAITSATCFPESHVRLMVRNLASALAYLHGMGIVHRDIKPENLLVELDADGQVCSLKLADFGLACEVTQPLLSVCGTPTYVAPEILMENGYGLKIDVWAAGIILYILLCGFPPFVSTDNQQEPLFDAILSGVYEFPEPYWTGISDDVRDLIANMLQSDPDLRFSSEDVLDHHWTLG